MLLTARRISIDNYRSIRRLAFDIDPLAVFVGANGAGKTNLFRALQLAQFSARGTLSAEIAREGGLEAAFWAGRRLPGPAATRISIELDLGFGTEPASFRYGFSLGFPTPTTATFRFEPQIKEERLQALAGRRAVTILERKGTLVSTRGRNGVRQNIGIDLLPSETALSLLDEASAHPEIDHVRRSLLDWRFHHGLRTDADSAMRKPALAVASPMLDPEGANLAAVLATLVHIRQDTVDLDRAISDAFPGARLDVPAPGREAHFGMAFSEHPHRVFEAGELSDGTLRYIGLICTVLSYRRPALLALNEPESSLHPDLLPPLARLLGSKAHSDGAAVWIATHSPLLAESLKDAGCAVRDVVKDDDGATTLAGLKRSGDFRTSGLDDVDESDEIG